MGNTVIVRHPDIPEEERARRMEAIKRAAVQLVLATERHRQERTKR